MVIHKPVLLDEVLELLFFSPKGWYLDATLGEGGHSAEICRGLEKDGGLVGIDRDSDAIESAKRVLSRLGKTYHLVKGCFSQAEELLSREGLLRSFDGALLDLGVSSRHLDSPERGFSYRFDSPLDMRMDLKTAVTAEEAVNELSSDELWRIFREYGEEKWAKRIALFIVESRQKTPIRSTHQLVDIIKDAVPVSARNEKKHPAKRCFQALRIYVNDEMGQLKEGLPQISKLLRKGGRIGVISYHSLEDRMVKSFIRDNSGKCVCPPGFPVCRCRNDDNKSTLLLKALTTKPVYPTKEEVETNPRARSARLRVAERIA